MPTSNAIKHGMSNESVWQFLAEYRLSEFLSAHDQGDDLTTGLLFQTVRELGMPPEYLENIERALTGFVKEALLHFKPGRLELPGHIRIFCQKKMIGEANSAKTARPYYTEKTLEHPQIIHRPGNKMDGGWGYFLIERGDDVSTGSAVGSGNSVELYLYKEGE